MGSDVHPLAIVHPGVILADGVSIGPYSVVGKPYRLVGGERYGSGDPTRVGPRCEVGAHVVIGQGTRIGAECIIEDTSIIEVDVGIGPRSHLLYGAQICNEASIGRGCIIGGFVCERAIVRAGSRIFGELLHSQLDPTAGWDDAEEPPPLVEGHAFVGFGAKIIGGIRIGRRAYVCAGAIVTRNVPDRHIAFDVNRTKYYTEWKGALSRSPLFRGGNNGKR